MRRGRAGGFSLLELMITLVILVILVTIAVPSFNNFVLATRLKNTASDIYASLVLARSEAIKRNTNVTVGPAVSGGPWANGWQVSVGGTILNSQGAVSKLKIECPAGTACTQTLIYGRNGKLTSGTVSLIVDDQSPTNPRRVPMRCVNVDLGGRVNIQADNNLDGNCANG